MEPYIAKYLHDKEGAFSITCDDGFRTQVEDTVEILDPLGLKATFFIIPYAVADDVAAQFVSWEQVRKLHADGHEIGTHASIVDKLHRVDDALRNRIINGGHGLILANTGIDPVCWANPGGSEMTGKVRAAAEERHTFLRAEELLPDAVIGGYGSTKERQWSDETGRKDLRRSVAEGKWRIAIVHSIVDGWSPFKSKDEFREHCRWVKAQDDLWTAPMGTVGRYVTEQRQSVLAVHAQDDGSMEFSVTAAAVPAEVFNSPLTVVVPVAAAAAEAVTADGGTALPVHIAPDKIMADVPADGTRIRVTWTPVRD